jgi:CRISPR-associated endonuclease Csn1
MKRVLGLDLGTTSIGWAFVNEAENDSEQSEIVQLGVRVNPLSTDEITDFEKGRPLSVNADRTLKRGMRRNLQRYKQRRENLIQILKEDLKFISEETPLTETGSKSTHETLRLRAKAVNEKLEKEELARVLLMINKKRGYKSSRKAKNEEEGYLIDGMAIAKQLYEQGLTPGQFVYELLVNGKKAVPDFYRSDLKDELDRIWSFQKDFYPEILTDDFYKLIEGQGKQNTTKFFNSKYDIQTAKNIGKDKRLEHYEWRSRAVVEQLSIEELAYVIVEINNNLNKSSGYLGAISDRSKELFFNSETVGQNLFKQIEENRHTSLKNQVFYRQDYLDEFERIWETQRQYHSEMTSEQKALVRDVVIFYQRRLKSQKHLVSFCEFEKNHRVCPKSSPLFQQAKIWQVLNNVELSNLLSGEKIKLSEKQEWSEELFYELNIKGNLKIGDALKAIGENPKHWKCKFEILEGNRTNESLYKAYAKIAETEGIEVDLTKSASVIYETVKAVFEKLGIDQNLLDFDPEIQGNAFDKQASYQLWHLLYSAEDDGKLKDDFGGVYGQNDVKLKHALHAKFSFKPEHTAFITNVTLQPDYGSLSTRAIKKLMPNLTTGYNLFEAAREAGYNHSSSLNKEELASRLLNERLDLLPKNSLRNPVVEKILNQMVNLVNAVIDDPNLGKPDEVRIELARELKKSAKERGEMTKGINDSKAAHDRYRRILNEKHGIKNPTRNDIIRYKLYLELEPLGFKTLYSNTYVDERKLFSKEIDIEHIIPKARLFDDSFSNKALSIREVNIKKGNATALDFIASNYGLNGLEDYHARVELLFKLGKISRGKYKKLLMSESKIPEGFIDRDLRNSQYIAKKAKQMLEEVIRTVNTTTGVITDKLREDWGIVNVMKELNLPKYRSQGLTKQVEMKDGTFKESIIDWTKRNDHRHHAMDALVVAFTTYNHVQYLNNLNAANDEQSKLYRLKSKITFKDSVDGKRKFKPPMESLRVEAKSHLESVLISYKAKNKVVTKNKNRIKKKGKDNYEIKAQLTPRGQLHKETVYGKIKEYQQSIVKVGSAFDHETILKVTKPIYKAALLSRLEEFEGDPKKAFTGKNSLSKNPIYLDTEKLVALPEKVKLQWLEENYTIRKPIGPDLKIDKVIDEGIKRILQNRLTKFGGKEKEAFADLEKNPIWLNKEQGIEIKRVTISGVKNADPLHSKRDHYGNIILNSKGNEVDNDFISTGNNHHLAIYRDQDGKLQDVVVSFFEAVARVNENLPIIDKDYNSDKGWQFIFSMMQNECFVFSGLDFNPSDIDLFNRFNKPVISKYLFKVQKFSKLVYGNSSVRDYVFRHHLETTLNDHKELKELTYKSIKSLGYFEGIMKVRLNHLGNIVKVGE